MACDKCKIVELTNRVEVLEKREEIRVAYDTAISDAKMNEWSVDGCYKLPFSKIPSPSRSEQDMLDDVEREKLSTMEVTWWY